MQAVKEKFQSMNATRKAKQEAKAEEKVPLNYYQQISTITFSLYHHNF